MKNLKILTFISVLLFLSCKEKVNSQIDEATIAHINAPEFKAKTGEENTQLIDVRTPEEFAEAHLKSAQNINFYDTDFMDKMQGLDKNKAVYVYCRSGKRSANAADKLKNAGFSTVYNLKGGILAWQELQFETEK